MTLLAVLAISIVTIVASALVSSYINVSRERLWLKAKKAEELYIAIDQTHVSVTTHIAEMLDIYTQTFTRKHDLANSLSSLAPIKMSALLYFPEVTRELACVDGSAKSLASALKYLSDRENKDGYDDLLNDLDSAICNFSESLNLLKHKVLSQAVIKEDWFTFSLRRKALPSMSSRTSVGFHTQAY